MRITAAVPATEAEATMRAKNRERMRAIKIRKDFLQGAVI
jgi:hypothetical protein